MLKGEKQKAFFFYNRMNVQPNHCQLCDLPNAPQTSVIYSSFGFLLPICDYRRGPQDSLITRGLQEYTRI
jgi:hypothetical protein